MKPPGAKKKGNKNKPKNHHQGSKQPHHGTDSRGSRPETGSRTISSSFSSSGTSVILPQSFPSHLPRPDNDFLRNQSPYKESFQAALSTAYEGFVVDPTIESPKESKVQASLESMRAKHYFRRDVTQPFGLGTKCAKTYVTRCLVGEPGTTYKYLGLRMFAYPWTTQQGNLPEDTIQELAKTLKERTKYHLRKLDETRKARGAPTTKGRPDFDICLINRMQVNGENLKDEPSLQNMKTSVSWHADSSLEHYSTIAVYQTILKEGTTEKAKKKRKIDANKEDHHWYVALRVAHHSEGPHASRRGTDIKSAIVKETPPIAASLPSGSAYYLLDDFNHHHQHTVLTDADDESPENYIRYSCTYRLLRDSHNVEYVLQRCQSTVSHFHKKGAKIWRSEQLLLTEMESEWIRQFYIQGSQHYDLLANVYWKEPMDRLLKYWGQLENRTKQTIDLLRFAAECKCKEKTTWTSAPSKPERKAHERRKKALSTLQDLLGRSEAHSNALNDLYQPMADMLEDRATMRELWAKREKDHVFTELDLECRPLPLPFRFERPIGESTGSNGAIASQLPGTPVKLREIAKELMAFGRAFLSGRIEDLPATSILDALERKASPTDSNHSKSLDWDGWKRHDFGLELQEPWAGAVVDGRKKIETRLYDFPVSLMGKRIWIIQSPSGKAGVSSMSDFLDFGEVEAKVIGWCIIDSVTKYTTKESFEADESAHLVSPDSGYGWKEGTTSIVYGWNVGECGRVEPESAGIVSGTRRMRSLFELKWQEKKERKAETMRSYGKSQRKKKRKKRY